MKNFLKSEGAEHNMRVEFSGSLMSKGHPLGSVVPTSLSWLPLGKSLLQVTVKQPGYVKLGTYTIRERKERKKKTKASLKSEGILQAEEL